MSENKSRLSRMRNVRANAAGLLRRAPSFLPESSHHQQIINGCGRVSRLTRSNSSSSTFYVQLPASKTEVKNRLAIGYRQPVISNRSPSWQRRRETDSSHDSDTSGCESGRFHLWRLCIHYRPSFHSNWLTHRPVAIIRHDLKSFEMVGNHWLFNIENGRRVE